jgi:signal transduction histidine kinase
LSRYPNDELLPQMDADIQRLQTIAERFSKIGSEPELVREDVCVVVQNTVDYMRTRTSSKVQYYIEMSTPCFVELNIPLFAWVLENIIKNAVDAMEGVGRISLSLSRDEDKMYLDISDTGKGIERGMFNRIFEPGYTSKKRGWGLGLSLSKRIIEDYHGGKLFVKSSQVGVGSTFRISMEESKNS